MSVSVSQEAYRTIISYATTHSTKVVHGILVGSSSDNKAIVEDAFPICHETPTRPLLDMAKALVEAKLAGSKKSSTIIGWFMSPEILSERKSDPVAMRVVSVLPHHSEDGVLLVLQNEEIGRLASDDNISAAECFQCFGKDFGKQWTKVLEVSVVDDQATTDLARKDITHERKIDDLTDHWENGGSSPWDPIVA